jgi:plasmid stabilization system protein ParE
MKLIISRKAWSEILDAKEYYTLQQENLGERFYYDIKNAIDNIKSLPNLYPNITDNIKRTLLHRFPYSIFYTIKDGVILILSVAHQHKKPKY